MRFKKALYRALPLANVATGRLGLRRDILSAATEIDELQPQERETVPAPLALPREFERATASDGHSRLSDQLEAARVREVCHAPVIRYRLRDCLVTAAGVERPAARYQLRAQGLAELVTGPPEEIDAAFFAMDYVSQTYFGHYLRDACSRALLAEPDETLLLADRPEWLHAAPYRDALCLPAQAPLPAFVRRLTLCRDHGQGSSKRARYGRMRRRLARELGLDAVPARDVFLRRGATGAARVIANEDAVSDRLAAVGFRIVDVDGKSLSQLARDLGDARRVVSMEGSHINHYHFLAPDGAALLALIPADRFTLIHHGISAAFGRRFGYMVLDRCEAGYAVDMDRLLRTLDLFD
ncbi:glycosyltransferase 61 family protein [Roseovarius salis]|uniref:glycosyltransferase 61 family protein n=1 Tax=Roseovarius salis TaxID=3376063 RepID=UPI0037C54910